ncbi:hypothetical protein AURDEDRAFT_151983, partial [Auricularia subglabra TFB-10046 SS5]
MFLQSLQPELEAAIELEGGLASVDATNAVVERFRAKFEDCVARALSERNSRASSARLIPRELWLYIWRYLPFDDIVAASRVCRSWRALAYAAPELWTAVDIHWLHGQCCDCDDEEPFCAVDNNLGLARLALTTLSRNKSVAVRLRSSLYREREDFESQVIKTVTECTPRLVALDIECNDKQFASNIVRGVRVFPSLKTLTIRSIEPWRRGEPLPFAGRSVELPALQHLDLAPGCVWPTIVDQLKLPS